MTFVSKLHTDRDCLKYLAKVMPYCKERDVQEQVMEVVKGMEESEFSVVRQMVGKIYGIVSDVEGVGERLEELFGWVKREREDWRR